MKPRTSLLLAATLSLAVTQLCNAQGVSIGEGNGTGIGTGAGVGSIIMPSRTSPVYSLVEESQSARILADGTRIEYPKYIRREYHDSHGRTRYEMYQASTTQPSDTRTPYFFTITDPVAGYNYRLSPGEHRAYATSTEPQPEPVETVLQTRSVEPAPSSASSPPEGQIVRPQPQTVVEELGTTTMNGVQVRGTRVTTTYPVGFEGNDRPITSTAEQWVAPQYAITMYSKNDDPRTGTEISRVTEFNASEPDASLFVVPPDYDIVQQR